MSAATTTTEVLAWHFVGADGLVSRLGVKAERGLTEREASIVAQDYCNITVRLNRHMMPSNQPSDVPLNASQVEKVDADTKVS